MARAPGPRVRPWPPGSSPPTDYAREANFPPGLGPAGELTEKAAAAVGMLCLSRIFLVKIFDASRRAPSACSCPISNSRS